MRQFLKQVVDDNSPFHTYKSCNSLKYPIFILELIKMKSILHLLCIALFFSVSTYAQSWQWARAATCASGDPVRHFGSEGWLAETDQNNNIYMAGYNFGDGICFGTYSFHVTNYPTNNTQIIIAKYNESGKVLWADKSENGNALPLSIKTDHDGNLLLFGYLSSDSISFGSTTIKNPFWGSPWSSYYSFLVKYDSNGNFIWAKGCAPIFPPTTFNANTIGIDKENNIYVTAPFYDSTLQTGPYKLYNHSFGTTDIFLAKFNSSGDVVWAKNFGGNATDESFGLAINSNDRLFLTGRFNSSTITFDPLTLTNTGLMHAFIAEINTSGTCIWANRSEGGSAGATCIAIDHSNNIYVGGNTGAGAADTNLILGSYTFHIPYKPSIFISKYDTAGNIIWAKNIANISTVTYENSLYSIGIDKFDNVWISGKIGHNGNMQIDLSTIIYPPSIAADPSFIVQYNASGSLIRHMTLPSGGDDNNSIVGDRLGNMYFCGDFLGSSMVFGQDTLSLVTGEDERIFLAKFGYQTSIKNEQKNLNDIVLFPIPANDELNIVCNSSIGINAKALLYDITGRLIHSYALRENKTTVSLADIAPGMYKCAIIINEQVAGVKKVTVTK